MSVSRDVSLSSTSAELCVVSFDLFVPLHQPRNLSHDLLFLFETFSNLREVPCEVLVKLSETTMAKNLD